MTLRPPPPPRVSPADSGIHTRMHVPTHGRLHAHNHTHACTETFHYSPLGNAPILKVPAQQPPHECVEAQRHTHGLTPCSTFPSLSPPAPYTPPEAAPFSLCLCVLWQVHTQHIHTHAHTHSFSHTSSRTFPPPCHIHTGYPLIAGFSFICHLHTYICTPTQSFTHPC